MVQLRLGTPAEFKVGQVYKHEKSGPPTWEVVVAIDHGQPVMGTSVDRTCPWGWRVLTGEQGPVPSDMPLEWTYVGALSP